MIFFENFHDNTQHTTHNTQHTTHNRDSNFELLRILAMMCIILYHLCHHGLYFPTHNTNYYLLKSIWDWTGMVGNYLFMLLSGYFLSNSTFTIKKFINKFIHLWLQVLLISISIAIIVFLFKLEIADYYTSELNNIDFFQIKKTITTKDIIKAFFPIYFGNNWYATGFLLFYVMVPFLNKTLQIFQTQKQFSIFLILLLTIGLIIPNLPLQNIYTPQPILYFIISFYTAYFIKIYDIPKIISKKFLFIFSIILCCLIMIYSTLIDYFISTNSYPSFGRLLQFANNTGMTNPFYFVLALSLFILFKDIKIPHNRIVNFFGGTTFSVYLIHENKLIKMWLWHSLFKMDKFIYSKVLIPYILFCIVVTFISCSIIGYLFQLITEKILKLFFSKTKSCNMHHYII